MNALPWLSDAAFNICVDNLIERIDDAQAEARERIDKNVPDPFWMSCVAHLRRVGSKEDLLDAQMAASISNGISSAIGNFHQKIIGNIKGFENHDAGYDVESRKLKIVAEIKNKHNTMNSKNRKAVEQELRTIVSSKPGYNGYLVIIIPRRAERYCIQIDRRVYEVDGATFYEKATGSSSALRDLHNALTDRLCSHSPEIAEYIRSQYEKSLPQ